MVDLYNPETYKNGCSRIRVIGVDLSPINTAIAVSEYTDTVRGAVSATKPEDELPWREQVDILAPRKQMIANYNVNAQDPSKFSAWVHKRVVQEELKPVATARKSWEQMVKDDLAKLKSSEEVFADFAPFEEHGTFYPSLSLLAAQRTAAATVNSAAKNQLTDQSYLSASRNFALQLARAECIPLFSRDAIFVVEGQLDQTKYAEYKYQHVGLRDQKLLSKLFDIMKVGRVTTDVAHELLRRYDKVTGAWRSHAPLPENFMYMMVFAAAIHIVDAMHGRAGKPRIFVTHNRKFAVDAYLAAETDYNERNPRADSGKWSDKKLYDLRKDASFKVHDRYIERRLELLREVPDEVESLELYRNDYLVNSTSKAHNYDAGDANGIADDFVASEMRFKAYTAPERATIQEADKLWAELLSESAELFNMTEEQAATALVVQPKVTKMDKFLDTPEIDDEEFVNTKKASSGLGKLAATYDKSVKKRKDSPNSDLKAAPQKRAKPAPKPVVTLDTTNLVLAMHDDLEELLDKEPTPPTATPKKPGTIGAYFTAPGAPKKPPAKKTAAKKTAAKKAGARKIAWQDEEDDEPSISISSSSSRAPQSSKSSKSTGGGTDTSFGVIDREQRALQFGGGGGRGSSQKSRSRQEDFDRDNTIVDIYDYNN